MKKNNTTIQWAKCAIVMFLVFTATSALAITGISPQSSSIRDITQSENNDRPRPSFADVAEESVTPDCLDEDTGTSISGTLTGLTTGDIVLIEALDAHGGYGKTEVIAQGKTAEYTISFLMGTLHYVTVYSENYLAGYYGGKGEKLVPLPHQTVFVDTANGNVSGIDIVMDHGHTISGRVEGLGENNFATLRATSETTGYFREGNVAGSEYTMRGVWPAQDYKVLIMSSGYIGGYYSADGTGENADAVDSMVDPRNIDFTLSRGQKVSGTINGLKNNEFAMITIKRESIHGDLARVFGDEARTFVVGGDKPVVKEWVVSGLKASNDFIAVFRPFYHVIEVRAGIDTSTDVTGVDFVMSNEEGNTMWGSISNAEAGQVVSISAFSKIANHGNSVQVTADADGAVHYEIKGLSNAPDYIVRASVGVKILYFQQTVEKDKAMKVDMGSEYVIGINFDFSVF